MLKLIAATVLTVAICNHEEANSSAKKTATARAVKEYDSLSLPIQNGKRVALVIGNSAYRHHGILRNPVNDAAGMAEALTQLGFQVTHKPNLTRAEMDQSIQEFGSKISDSEIALFYYAGHAVQINGNNYLIPTDAQITDVQKVEVDAVNAEAVFNAMRSERVQLNLIILDACRDNPFRKLTSFKAALPDFAPGLAPPKNAPDGTLIAYATEPGRLASDGSGKHSPYTRALLKFIRQPGLELEDFFKRVREHVKENTDKEQIPWENTSVTGDFFFSPPAFIECQIEEADDEAYVYINDSPVVVSGDRGLRKVFLNPGSNSMEIKIYNQKTRRGILGPREGWRYTIKFRSSGKEIVFSESEDNPPDEHWGKTFTRIKRIIDVDENTGLVTIR
ncbi:MAG TPA: caspase family protein [Pyrinomonadaceae bacterium]